MKLSRHLNFAICENFAFLIFAFLSETNLEIPVDAAIRMEASTKNVEASERFKQLVEQHYKEPGNGQLEDCTKDVLPGVETESSSDAEEDQNITTE